MIENVTYLIIELFFNLIGEFVLYIVTVVYNDEKNIQSTLKSIQPYLSDNISGLVIDGGSSDNTLNIVKKFDFKYISEKDNGVYDAMNKAIDIVSDDDYLLFINSGDMLCDNIDFAFIDNIADCIFCSTISILDNGDDFKYYHIKKYDYINESNLFQPKIHHQGFIGKKKVIGKFNLSLGELADLQMMLECLNKTEGNLFLPELFLSKYTLGGISDRSGLDRIKSYIKLCRYNEFNIFKFINRSKIGLIKLFIKGIIPFSIVRYLRDKC